MKVEKNKIVFAAVLAVIFIFLISYSVMVMGDDESEDEHGDDHRRLGDGLEGVGMAAGPVPLLVRERARGRRCLLGLLPPQFPT